VSQFSDDESLPGFRDNWQREFTLRAREYWTAERTAELANGKALLLPPAESAPLLRALGLLHRDASMPPRQIRKYWQCCHMVTLMQAQLRDLMARHKVVNIIDAGCGRSYLTIVIAWIAKNLWNAPDSARVHVLGIDRNADVIEECYRRVRLLELEDCIAFKASSVQELDLALHAPVHAVISLHACDTATCDALALAVRANAEFVAVAPCCQAELARGWAKLAEACAESAEPVSNGFSTIWKTPHLRRETAADITDAMRASLLASCGYQVGVIEFVPSEHTRKNTLIKATRNDVARARDGEMPANQRAASSTFGVDFSDYRQLVNATGGVGIALGVALTASR
jgi:Methyltransferase domain